MPGGKRLLVCNRFHNDVSVIDFDALATDSHPDVIDRAFADGDILQVLFFSVLFGISLAAVGERGAPVLNFLQAVTSPMFKLVEILMKAAPIGAFGAMAFTIGKYGIGAVVSLAMLVGTFYLTAAIFVVVVLGTVAWWNGFSIFKLLRYLKEELLLVLGTSSSEAALPSLMEKLERAGAKRSVVGLVVPTGYSFNLDGTNIYMTLAALFIAQACDIHLSLGEQALLQHVETQLHLFQLPLGRVLVPPKCLVRVEPLQAHALTRGHSQRLHRIIRHGCDASAVRTGNDDSRCRSNSHDLPGTSR